MLTKIERVQTGVRLETRLLKVMKGIAEYNDMGLGDLIEGVMLHAFDGKLPFSPATLTRIAALRQVYGLDLTAANAHQLSETEPVAAKPYAAHYATDHSIKDLIVAFGEGTFPASAWKHREHCVATAGLILFHPELDLEKELPGMIKRYNIAQGGQNTDTSGYHHTLTLFYLAAINDFLKRQSPRLSAPEKIRALLASPLGNKDYPLRFYSKDLLFSKVARLGWIEPDLQPVKPV